MISDIFATFAPLYWQRGLPVIPLRMQEKRPAIAAWSEFCKRLPNPDEQQAWLTSYQHGNLGLPLGPQSGLVMVDIDTDDQTVINAIMDVLAPFPAPWKRIGKKGFALAYRQPVGGELKPFKLKAVDTNQMIVEMLSTGNQIVLPPSVHPDTKRPYEANCDLLDVLDQLVPLPADIEDRMRNTLEALGFKLSMSGMSGLSEFTSAGNRDNEITRAAGLLAHEVTAGKIRMLDAINHITSKVETFTEKVAGDVMDPRKGVQSLCGFLLRDVMVGKRPLPLGWDEGLDDKMKEGLGLKFSEEHEEWDYEKILTYLRSEHEQHGSMSQGWNNAVDFILERIARSTSLTEIAAENILRYIQQASGGQITMGVLRRQLKEKAAGEIKGTDHTEIAEAALEYLNQFGELRHFGGKFWQFVGSHWEVKEDDEILRLISSKYGHLQAANRRNHHVGIKATMATLAAKELQTVRMRGVNFANGFLTQDMKLVQHDKEYGCSYTLPYRYLGDQEECPPQFKSFLDRCFIGDTDASDKIAAIQEAIAATMFGEGPTYCRAVLLFGPGRTGKSELLKIISSLLPDEVISTVTPEQLRDKFATVQLTGKLLNIAGELSNTKSIDSQVFKQVVAGEGIEVQYKYQQAFTLYPVATHWFGSNHLPRAADDTDGFTRRWLIIRFEHPIRQEETIPHIARRIIMAEREQIVSWAMQAMPRLVAQSGYTMPESHKIWLEEVANQNNTVRLFLTESGLVQLLSAPASGDGWESLPYVTDTKLYQSYSGFCSIGLSDAQRALLPQFRRRMRELSHQMGFMVKTVPVMAGVNETRYYNLTLAEPKAA